jgi:hypothetical protein
MSGRRQYRDRRDDARILKRPKSGARAFRWGKSCGFDGIVCYGLLFGTGRDAIEYGVSFGASVPRERRAAQLRVARRHGRAEFDLRTASPGARGQWVPFSLYDGATPA